MRIWKFAALLALMLTAVSAASAAVVTVTPLGPGGVPLPALPLEFGAVATFDGVQQTPYGSTTPAGSFDDGGGAWSGLGLVMNNAPGTAGGLYAEPYNDTSNYMAVMRGRTETVAYTSLRSKLGLYWGSIDAYNSLTLYDDISSRSVVVPVPQVADGSQFSVSSNRYFVISGFDFDRVAFESIHNSFEFDNVATVRAAALVPPQYAPLASGVPEPAEWVMILLGFAAIGTAKLRLSRNRRASIRV